eukprot:6291128-Pyramimonas_sp.AAC.1
MGDIFQSAEITKGVQLAPYAAATSRRVGRADLQRIRVHVSRCCPGDPCVNGPAPELASEAFRRGRADRGTEGHIRKRPGVARY